MKEKAVKQEQHQPSKQNGKVDEFGIPPPSNDSYRYVLAYMRGVYMPNALVCCRAFDGPRPDQRLLVQLHMQLKHPFGICSNIFVCVNYIFVQCE